MAEIIHRRVNELTHVCEYYVHYDGFNRRLDEWVRRDRIKGPEEEVGEKKGEGGAGGQAASEAGDAEGNDRKITR